MVATVIVKSKAGLQRNKYNHYTFTGTVDLNLFLLDDAAAFNRDLLYEHLAEALFNIWEDVLQKNEPTQEECSTYTVLGMNGKFAPPRWVKFPVRKIVPLSFIFVGGVSPHANIDALVADMKQRIVAATGRVCGDILAHAKESTSNKPMSETSHEENEEIAIQETANNTKKSASIHTYEDE